MIEHLVATGIDAALACRVLRVSRSGFYAWKSRLPSERARVDEELTVTIIRIHRESRTSYGARRVHAELRLGLQIRCGKKRVARLMRRAGIAGISHRRKRGKNRPLPAPHEDLVKRQFVADRPDKLWVTDITEHPTRTGKVYCAAVVDVFSRRVVGWAIADHIRAELVVDALDMARWRRKPEPGTVVHSDRGSQYTSWVFGHRLRQAGLLGSMGRVASRVDNGLMESFWSTMQRELFDQQAWQSRDELGQAIFEWIEAWYNPKRRHSGIGDVSPLEFENTHHAAIAA
ncbi:IS3 family transposase [Microbacterium hominis]|uniref:IS3 family transposase n=1 Tax=Microbacterium hominis TaxID=162426 RepID=UPI0019633AF6|nr:IS3 family transposase [Microbacterium hominis]QRY40569.1 IS3 family transposase [Microbacterium hominis]